jgi:hypothetical protein
MFRRDWRNGYGRAGCCSRQSADSSFSATRCSSRGFCGRKFRRGEDRRVLRTGMAISRTDPARAIPSPGPRLLGWSRRRECTLVARSTRDAAATQPPRRTRDLEGDMCCSLPLAGRKALITGGTKGIGAAVALRSGRHRRPRVGREPTSQARPTRGQPTRRGDRGQGSPRALAPCFSRQLQARGAGPWWPTVRRIRAACSARRRSGAPGLDPTCERLGVKFPEQPARLPI